MGSTNTSVVSQGNCSSCSLYSLSCFTRKTPDREVEAALEEIPPHGRCFAEQPCSYCSPSQVHASIRVPFPRSFLVLSSVMTSIGGIEAIGRRSMERSRRGPYWHFRALTAHFMSLITQRIYLLTRARRKMVRGCGTNENAMLKRVCFYQGIRSEVLV